MVRIVKLDSLEIIKRRWFSLMSRALHMSMKEEQERPKISRELIERLTNMIEEYAELRL